MKEIYDFVTLKIIIPRDEGIMLDEILEDLKKSKKDACEGEVILMALRHHHDSWKRMKDKVKRESVNE